MIDFEDIKKKISGNIKGASASMDKLGAAFAELNKHIEKAPEENKKVFKEYSSKFDNFIKEGPEGAKKAQAYFQELQDQLIKK